MSFNKDGSIIGQNAGTTAAAIYTALIAQRGDTQFNPDEYDSIRRHVFQGSLELGGVESIAEILDSNGGARTNTTSNGSRASSSGGSGSSGSTDHGAGVVLNFGKFKDKTIQQAYDEDATYIQWLADNGNNPFIKNKAEEFLQNVAA